MLEHTIIKMQGHFLPNYNDFHSKLYQHHNMCLIVGFWTNFEEFESDESDSMRNRFGFGVLLNTVLVERT